MTTTLDRDRFDAVIFDLDGVITDTASVHRAAWKRLFDDYLAERSEDPAEDHEPFTDQDYLRHVDGKPRLDGVRDFLVSRGIEVDEDTVAELGDRKNDAFLATLEQDGVVVFPSTVELICRLHANGIRTAVFSASRNCRPVLETAGLLELFEARVDGVVAGELGLPGKPDPASLLEATRRIDATPERTVVVEDAQAGVQAGKRGGFGLVIGIDREGMAEGLRAHGADVVVDDLEEVTMPVEDEAALAARVASYLS